MPSASGRVLLLAGHLSDGHYSSVQRVVAVPGWQAVLAVSSTDASLAGLGQQVKECSEWVLRERSDITHIWYFAPPRDNSSGNSTPGLQAFQRLAAAAAAAGAVVQQLSFSAYDSGANDSGAVEPSSAAVADVQLDMLPTIGAEGAIGLQAVSIRTTSPRPSKHDGLSQVYLIADPRNFAGVLNTPLLEGQQSLPPAVAPVSTQSALSEVWTRGRWLLGLLVLQSASSAVLDSYQDLLKRHLAVTFFLTMLVGAGGNAGNQSAIKVIRGLAMRKYCADADSMRQVLLNQILIAGLLGSLLGVGGLLRVWVTPHSTMLDSVAIGASAFLIVLTSVLLGTLLPFLLARARIDPAHAGSSIQVLMDVLGVVITMVVCNAVLGTVEPPQLEMRLAASALKGASPH